MTENQWVFLICIALFIAGLVASILVAGATGGLIFISGSVLGGMANRAQRDMRQDDLT